MTIEGTEIRSGLREYFLLFGCPEPWDYNYREGYWDENPKLWQVVLGIVLAPIFGVVYLAILIMTLPVNMGGTSSRKASPSTNAAD